ncbi:MAG: Coenzyme F420 hydrogenase/dehydrogenase, beta subunit C-terminal domain [Halobacteriota archaeon]
MEEKRDFSDLKREVIEKGKCALCGGCVATCRLLDYGYLSVDFSEERPVIREGQQCPPDCGYCYYQCPRVEKPALREGLEEMYEVVSTDEGIRRGCQDGGAVTSLLAYALDDAIVEGCITVADKGEWKPEVQVAMDKAGLIKGAGSKYTPAATLTGIADTILKHDLWSAALVGTPCVMSSYEKMLVVGRDTHNAHNFSSHVRLRIGLFCMGSYSYEKLMKGYLEHEHGIDISEVTKLQISEDVLHVYEGEKELLSTQINEVEDYKRDGCKVCEDFTGLFSDISVGNVGSPAGKSSVIIRTDFGKEIFEGALERGYIEAKPMDKSGVDLIHRLMKGKKEAGIAEKERRKKKLMEQMK